MTRARELADLLTGGQTITTADNTTQLTLESTDADSSVGPVLDLVRDSASPADGDAVGQIKYIADNDAGEATTYSSAFTTLRDASDGAEDGQVINYVITGGSLVDHLRMGRGSANGQSEVVINEGSADIAFRVESDSNANMLFVDGGNDKVGIGTASGSGQVTIEGDGSTRQLVITDDDVERLQLYHIGNDSTIESSSSGSNSTNLIFKTSSSGTEAERLRIQSAGGISFNGDTATANALDDYEEGTWTAQMLGTSSNPSATVTAATANYTKIGKVVWAGATFVGVDTTGASGGVVVSGMPFDSDFTVPMGNVMSQNTFNVGTNVANITPFWANSTQVWFYHTLHGSNIWGAVQHSAGTSRYLYLSLIYTTAS